MASTTPDQSPVNQTISRLANHKNVRGVLILSRSTGIVLASSGPLFAPPPTPLPPPTSRLAASEPTPPSSQEIAKPLVNGGGEEAVEEGVSVSEVARRYAESAVKMVEAVGEEVRGVGEEGDDLRLLRIRTRRHELIITPDEQYILVVAQDPSN